MNQYKIRLSKMVSITRKISMRLLPNENNVMKSTSLYNSNFINSFKRFSTDSNKSKGLKKFINTNNFILFYIILEVKNGGFIDRLIGEESNIASESFKSRWLMAVPAFATHM